MADTYRIEEQREVPDLNRSGRFVNVHEITYEVTNGPAKGSIGMVKVQQEDYNDKYVDAAIRAQISAKHSIAGLGEEPVK